MRFTLRYSNVVFLSAIAIACVNFDVGAEADTSAHSTVRFGGSVSYRMLQLASTGGLYEKDILWGDDRQIQRQWQHRVAANALLTIAPLEHVRFTVGYRAAIGTAGAGGSGLSECNVVFERPEFTLTGGIFNFRYNSDARNLGEYLILSGCYPGFVFSEREWANHVGIHFHTDAVAGLSQDILLITHMDQIPYFDFSLAYIGGYSFADMLEIGAGIMFHRLIPVQPQLTTPAPEWVDSTQVTYTHRGIKVMARASCNIKHLFGEPRFLGEHDLKLYAEAALLGVEDYRLYYEDKLERIPVMVGINVPTFKLLDYCAIEGEWYGSPHNNVAPYLHYQAVPVEADLGSVDDFKWSVSVQRSLGKSIVVLGRAARDHFRFEDASGGVEVWERIVAPQHWYWSLKTKFTF